MKLGEEGLDVRSAIESIQDGEILRLYDVYVSDKKRATEIGEALGRREDFVISKGNEDERKALLEAFRSSCESEFVKALLKEKPDFFVEADRAIFAWLNSKDSVSLRLSLYGLN
jgi:hypothetical protein